jgi:hypothetical protein
MLQLGIGGNRHDNACFAGAAPPATRLVVEDGNMVEVESVGR